MMQVYALQYVSVVRLTATVAVIEYTFRHVAPDLTVREDFMCLKALPDTSSETLFQAVTLLLEQLNIPIANCRGKNKIMFIFM